MMTRESGEPPTGRPAVGAYVEVKVIKPGEPGELERLREIAGERSVRFNERDSVARLRDLLGFGEQDGVPVKSSMIMPPDPPPSVSPESLPRGQGSTASGAPTLDAHPGHGATASGAQSYDPGYGATVSGAPGAVAEPPEETPPEETSEEPSRAGPPTSRTTRSGGKGD